MALQPLRAASRTLLLALLALSPLCLGRLSDWEPLALLLVTSLASLLWLLGGGRLLPRVTRAFDYLLLCGALLCALVTPFTVYLYDSLLGLSLLYGGLLAFYVARACFADVSWRKVAWWCTVGGGVVAGLWGAREYVQNAVVMGDSSWRAFGPFYNPNCLGGYMAMLIAIPVALALGAGTRRATDETGGESGPSERTGAAGRAPRRGKGKKTKAGPAHRPPAPDAPRYPEIAGAVSALVLLLGLLCTGSRGAVLAALASGLLLGGFGAQPGSALRRFVRLGAGAAVVFAILGALTFPPIRNRILGDYARQQHSGSFRVYTWKSTARMVAARPLTGFGPGTFAHAFPGYAQAGFTRQAHQTPLQFGAEYGVPAALLLLAGLGWAVIAAVRGAAGLPNSERLLAVAGAGGVVALWLHNMVDYTWYVAAFNGVSWVLLGLAVAPAEAAGTSEAARGAPSEPARGSRIALLPATGLLAVWSVVGLHSELQRSAAKALVGRGDGSAARERLARALPIDAYRWTELSRIAEGEAASGRPGALREAIQYRRRAIALVPTEPTNYTALGRMLVEADDLDGARDAMQQAVSYHPTSTDALAALGRVLELRGEQSAALDVYRRLVALHDAPYSWAQAVEYFVDRNYVYGWVPLAREALKGGDKRLALDYSSKAADRAVEYLASVEQYRQMLELSGRYDLREIGEMEQHAVDAVGILRKVGTPPALLRAAWTLQGLGKDAEAADEFVRAAAGAAEGGTATDRAVKAAADLGRAECLWKQGAPEAEGLLAGARAAAQQVAAKQGANGLDGGGAWQAQDTRRLQEALQRTAPEAEPQQ